jgi:hypothetical protein
MAEDKRIEAAMKLGMSREDALAMLAEDKRIDRGEVMEWDLPPEEHKKAMKYANSDEKKKKAPTAYNFDTSGKKRKENPTKAGIIAELARFLTENSEYATENVEITNKERQIAFKIGNTGFELTLVQKRKPKS